MSHKNMASSSKSRTRSASASKPSAKWMSKLTKSSPSKSKTHSHELNRELERQILVNLRNPASILREKFKRGGIYYEVQLHHGKKIKLKDQDALKLMPNQLLAYYEKLYNWADIGMYNMTLAELVRQTEYLQHVIVRSNRTNLKVQHIRGGLRTTEGFFFAVKWKNIFAYDYVDVNFMKEHHLEQILLFYQGLSLTHEYCKGLFNY